MNELLLLPVVILSFITLSGAVLYHRHISKARDEYEKAEEVIGDVMISFNKELQRQEDSLNLAISKTGIISSRYEKVSVEMSQHDKQLAGLNSEISSILENTHAINPSLETTLIS